MNKTMRVLLFSAFSIVLAGCSVEGKNDYGSYYQKQQSLNVLKMPPGVTQQGADNYYVVPPGPTADVKTVSILPPGSRAYESALPKNRAKDAPAIPAPAVASPSTSAVAVGDNTITNAMGPDKQ